MIAELMLPLWLPLTIEAVAGFGAAVVCALVVWRRTNRWGRP